ncbi:hypothetical protein RJT34_03789 [Clitoria ternatea]|uniref:Uncharacterized protein n=1 Tax=Clitoria ternatea TaxID=43366 RepID=A0AAN9KMA0_CLITE
MTPRVHSYTCALNFKTVNFSSSNEFIFYMPAWMCRHRRNDDGECWICHHALAQVSQPNPFGDTSSLVGYD